MNEPEQTALILLAAGKSARMGKPKQLLQLRGKSLLRHAAEVALSSRLGPLIVVLGAYADQMQPELEGINYDLVYNQQWEEGMGSSIRAGVTHLQQKYTHCRGAIVMLCDQPYVSVDLLEKLVHTYHKSHKPIIASAYRGTMGVPAYFHRSYFDRLSQLEGGTGARKLIKQHGEDAGVVTFSQGGIDIDTPEDYQMLKDKVAREEG
ncbi:MAG: NTP transferase domain-containing protein [Cyclobacteriaceae bacterium]